MATFSSMATQRVCDAMLPALSQQFGVSLAEAARVVSFFAVVYGLSQLIYGPLGDRFGKFRIVVVATLGCSLGSVASALAGSLDALLAGRVLAALCAAAIIPMTMAWIGDTVPYAQRQETLARVGLGTTMGLVSGQLLGGLMADTLGWRWAFALLAGLFMAVGFLLMRDMRGPAGEPSSATDAPGSFGAQTWAMLSSRWPAQVLLTACIEGAAGFGVLAIVASHLHHVLGLSLSQAGAVAALFGVGGMLYMATAKGLIPRLGESGLALAGGAGMAFSFALLGLATWWPLTVLASLSAGFWFFMFHNTMQTQATQMAPAARGTAVSLFAAFLFMGQALGVVAAASLSSWIGSGKVIVGGGLVILALGAWLARSLRGRARQALTDRPV
jgi:YNFM family putative membrane transporter